MLIPLQLLPVLQHHGDTEDENTVEPDDTESCSEDDIQIGVCKVRERADTALLSLSFEVVWANTVLYISGRILVNVSAAVELHFVSIASLCHGPDSQDTHDSRGSQRATTHLLL